MLTFFDIYALALLITSISVFVIRYLRQDPPVFPYLVIACTCVMSNWMGNAGGEFGAIGLLVAASFLFLGCVIYPRWRDTSSNQE